MISRQTFCAMGGGIMLPPMAAWTTLLLSKARRSGSSVFLPNCITLFSGVSWSK